MENYKRFVLLLFLIISTFTQLKADEKIIKRVLSHEGTRIIKNKTEYSKYGITKSYLKIYNKTHKSNYKVEKITYLDAQNILKQIYKENRLNEINSEKIKAQSLDIIFNTGPKGIFIIQETINEIALEKIKVDGIIGTETIKAINLINNKERLNEKILNNRIDFYKKLNNWDTYKKGWLKRIESYR